MCNEATTQLIDALKADADRHWWIDPRRSVEIGDEIIRIATENGCVRHTALGKMVRGDGLKYIGRNEEAWQMLDEAGKLFLQAGDEVGWARTRIGMLWICVGLQRTEVALADFPRAEQILENARQPIPNFWLHLNVGSVYYRLGDPNRALKIFLASLDIGKAIENPGFDYLGTAYFDIGAAYLVKGELAEAYKYNELAQRTSERPDDIQFNALVLANLAHYHIRRGEYLSALTKLNQAISLAGEKMPDTVLQAELTVVYCYVELNRFSEAIDLALPLAAKYAQFGVTHQKGLVLLHIATAYVGLAKQQLDSASDHLREAECALDEAEAIFNSPDSVWLQYMLTVRAQIALVRKDYRQAIDYATHALHNCDLLDAKLQGKEAALIYGQALYRSGENLDLAAYQSNQIINYAETHHMNALCYNGHLLMGHIRHGQGNRDNALYHYQTAAELVEHMQRDLTITLRPYFLEDKDAALRAMIHLHLTGGKVEDAFNTLERVKSQVFLSYLNNRDKLRWRANDEESGKLVEMLNLLRGEYHRLTASSYRMRQDEQAIADEDRLSEARYDLERRIRGITEKLYLRSAAGKSHNPTPIVQIGDIQRFLKAGDMLVEYFNDGNRLLAFTMTSETLSVYELGERLAEVQDLLQRLYANLSRVQHYNAEDPFANSLGDVARIILKRLYQIVMEPFAHEVRDTCRLIIIPYGQLHFVPFNVLYTGGAYLIERFEVDLLPTAALITRPSPVTQGRALALAYSGDDGLPGAAREVTTVHDLFGGEIYCGPDARQDRLSVTPRQVLHIAAHGKHMFESPELSYVELADGQLLTDDVLQLDMGYELVTLSACETGLSKIAGGDEMIGLGRGFLYAGAGALVTTLWPVNDDTTQTLMEHFYRALRSGASKAGALRQAQQEIIRQHAKIHPAFWGAFQLVGNPDPLSKGTVPVS